MSEYGSAPSVLMKAVCGPLMSPKLRVPATAPCTGVQLMPVSFSVQALCVASPVLRLPRTTKRPGRPLPSNWPSTLQLQEFGSPHSLLSQFSPVGR